MGNYFRRPATRSMYVLWFEGLKLVAVHKNIMYLCIIVHGCAHEEGPAYSIISDDEVPDFDDTISVGSQNDAPELLSDKLTPSANNEETMLFTVSHFPTGGAIVASVDPDTGNKDSSAIGSAVLQTVTNDEAVSNPDTNDLSDHTAVISTASHAVAQTATNHQIALTSRNPVKIYTYKIMGTI